MDKNLLCKVPSTLGLIVDVLLVLQLTTTLYQTFSKPKKKTTDNSQDNNRKENEL